jgi:hypothetical protein
MIHQGMVPLQIKSGDTSGLLERPVSVLEFLERVNINVLQRHQELFEAARNRAATYKNQQRNAWGFA